MRRDVLTALVATGAMAQDFGGQAAQHYAAQLWQNMVERNLAGDEVVNAFPYEATDPHGVILET